MTKHGDFNDAAYNQLLDELTRTKKMYEKKSKKYQIEQTKVKTHLRIMKKYIQKEMAQCNCSYTKSKALYELNRVNQLLK